MEKEKNFLLHPVQTRIEHWTGVNQFHSHSVWFSVRFSKISKSLFAVQQNGWELNWTELRNPNPQPTLMVPTVVSELTAPMSNDMHHSIIPTDPLFPPCLWPQRPYHLGEDIMEVGRGMCFIRVEEQDNDHYWITCQMDTQEWSSHSSWPRSRIDPNPQDMLSWLDRVESLMWLWWDIVRVTLQWSHSTQNYTL